MSKGERVLAYSLAVDIGGTFTDIVLRHSDGHLSVDKTLTTHHDLLEGFFRGVHAVLAKAGISSADVTGVVVHATTIVTNALIERKGLPTALVTTEGFRDVLTIRNEHRYDMYDPQIEYPEPLVAEPLTFGLRERILADGTVSQEIDAGEVAALADKLRQGGAKAVAVCLLNSYSNPAHEAFVAAELTRLLDDTFICTSSDIAPQIREYHRASTTAVNAYAMPISQPYLRRLADRLRDENFANSPLIMLSSGGIVGAETAGRNPVRMIESGPAAGALAACYYATLLGIDRLMSFDMGGTTAKACLIEDRTPLVTGLFEVDRRYRFKDGSGIPVTVPSIDLIEIGAGGGSIAHVDELGLLKVGPESAGSQPGPACYGRGGESPTVTDANLMLGLIDANNFLGGDMSLDKSATEAAMGRLAAAIDVDAVHAARGIYRVVTEAMAGAARTHATDRGVDYRGMPLFAFGGAGALHACAVAELLESTEVIVPPQSSVLSAFGTLVTPARLDLVRSGLVRVDQIDWDAATEVLDKLAEEGVAALAEAGCSAKDVVTLIGADMRYAGQQHEVTVTFEEDPRKARDPEALVQAFETAYRGLYGVNPTDVQVEIVTWRVTARGPLIEARLAADLRQQPGKPKAKRPVLAWDDDGVAEVWERSQIAVGQELAGPVVIEERETTTAVPPGWTATINSIGCIVARKNRAAQA
ncbi:hydantoinase/oxoprolinase family protein [Solimonas marina]|nr:hydantoinase/oxoprolinase family protein [Solimonas marina]